MRIAIERRQSAAAEPCLLEVMPSRVDTGVLSAAEGVLAAMSGAEPFALEIGADNRGPWFVVRTESDGRMSQLHAQLGSRYHHAVLRRLDGRPYPAADHGRLQAGECVAACTFTLRAAPYLPLRTFEDPDLKNTPQADPMVALLGALCNLPDGWRAVSQLVLRRAAHDWSDQYQRYAVERPLGESPSDQGRVSLLPVFIIGGLVLTGCWYLMARQLYQAGEWLKLAALVAGTPVVPVGGVWLVRKFATPSVYDRRLVEEKLHGIGYEAQLRLAVIAPAGAVREELDARLQGVMSAYGQYSLGTGNALVAQPAKDTEVNLRALAPWGKRGWPLLLTTRELAGLWHLPQGTTDVALLERTAVRHYLPLPDAVKSGCRIGISRGQGRELPVSLPDYLLLRHLLLVAKTGSGKSSLLELLFDYLVRTSQPEGKRALLLIDPHEDLAKEVLGRIPGSRRGDVVYLDAANTTRPFGLNLLDIGLGWTRDKATDTAISIFQREFSAFWGPRMENAFRHGLYTLFEANRVICASDPRHGRRRQYTILDTPALLVNQLFRRSVLRDIGDPYIHDWWASFFDPLDRKLQLETINPVQTKIYRFAGSLPARLIVGQPCSTVHPRAWLKAGSIVIVNTAAGTLSDDTAGMLGGALLNLVKLAVMEQSTVASTERQRLTLMVDEMHTMPAVNYEGIVAELKKFGANLIVSTQSLAQLDALDRRFQRALKSTLFSNVKGLFAFGMSDEDATYLAPEMGGSLDDQDLIGLGDHQCYVRMSDDKGVPLPAFSAELDRPKRSDAAVRQSLIAASAALYGRDATEVEEDLKFALLRVQESHRLAHGGEPGAAETGTPRGMPTDVPSTDTTASKPKRNEHRNQRGSDGGQSSFLPQLDPGTRSAADNGDPGGPSTTDAAPPAGPRGTA